MASAGPVGDGVEQVFDVGAASGVRAACPGMAPVMNGRGSGEPCFVWPFPRGPEMETGRGDLQAGGALLAQRDWRKIMKTLLGSVALAAVLASGCSPKSDGALINDRPVAPDPEAPAAKAWVSAAPVSATAPPPSIEKIPAGAYTLDPAHSTFMFSVSHLGFSNFTGWFDSFTADLRLDPANPSAAMLSASVDPASLTIHAPPAGFQEELRGAQYLDAKQFPQIIFKSTAITMDGPNTAQVTGDLTLHGITKPVTLSMTYNGGYEGHVYEPRARIGFSARGVFKRSDFGIGGGVPKEGSNMGVSDEVRIMIEAEFIGPDMKDPPKPAGQPS